MTQTKLKKKTTKIPHIKIRHVPKVELIEPSIHLSSIQEESICEESFKEV
jgi:hypothetical protein